MRSVKAWIAVAAVVLAVGAGATFAISSGGGNDTPTTPPTSVPAAAAGAPQTADPVTQQLVNDLASQLLQATSSGGQPKAITAEEAEALLRAQLQQLGIPVPK